MSTTGNMTIDRANSQPDGRPVLDGRIDAETQVRRMIERASTAENLRSNLVHSCRVAFENSGQPTAYGRQYWQDKAERLEALLQILEGPAGNLRLQDLKAALGMLTG